MGLHIAFFGTTENILKLLLCFLNEHKEEARAPRTNTRHINPSHWQSYSLYWRMRHALKKSGEGKGGERRTGLGTYNPAPGAPGSAILFFGE
jgi:hypothetical protein